MSKKYYVMIARVLAAAKPYAMGNTQSETIVREIANTLASELAKDNPRFDRARFLAACGQ